MPWLQIYFVTEWIIRFAMLLEVPRRRTSTAAMAWLVVVYFFPLPGLIAYLMFGANRPQKRRLRHYKELTHSMEKAREQHALTLDSLRPEIPEELRRFSGIVERFGGMAALGENNAELLSNPDAIIDTLISDIDQATHHVHLMFYIFEDDSVGRRVTDALERAVARGVSCRLLVDAMGSRKFLRQRQGALIQAGIQVYDSLPIVSIRRFFGRVDWRNHRKIAVIDGLYAYTGSRNIVEPGYGRKDSSLVWKDLMVRISGPAVISLQTVFLTDWYLESGIMVRDEECYQLESLEENIPIQVMPSGPFQSPQNYRRLVLSALYQAQERVTITTPYFVPDESMLQALETAAGRGVEVNLILPKKSDQLLPGYAARSYFDDLLEWGIGVHRYTGGLLHAKSLSVDHHLCFFGSSNFDIRSFALDYEVDLVFYGGSIAQELRELQHSYQADSEPLGMEQWSKRSYFSRLLENIAKLFSPLL
ncbi:MAG: cardiolipin synthase [Spirochaetales bacterium]|nr:cardiolipin synthase [Spirochaetales bacterium]